MHEPADPPTQRLAIDVRIGSAPVQGTIEDGAGTRPFFGWLDLIRAIEPITRGGGGDRD